MILDMICLLTSFVMTYVIHNSYTNGEINSDINSLCFNMALFIEVVDVAVFFIFGTLKNVLKREYYREMAATVRHVIIVELAALLYSFNLHSNADSLRTVLYIMAPVYLILTCVVRLLWKALLTRKKSKSGHRSLLIVTTSDIAEKVVSDIKNNNYAGFSIIGVSVVDKNLIGERIADVPVVADIESLSEYVCREWIDEVFIKASSCFELTKELIDSIIITGVTVHLNIDELFQTIGGKRFIEKVGNFNVLTTSINYATAGQAFLKRLLDICGGLVGTILTGIIFIFIAPIIYLKSPGPIFFSQIRIGKNGKKFKIYKFRSMVMDAEDKKKELEENNRVKDGMMFKLDFDERIIGNKKLPDGTRKTGIGNFIRATSLDEFPQFINVLKGDMSLVGTRPPTLDEWEKYELHHRARLATKPGITGMWQVSGRSKITDFEEVVKLDTKYISEWNLRLDIKILFKTISAVLKRDGSM